jgi:hypothetical protein
MGCENFVVGVDHKPLVGLYSPLKALSDIDNPRLRNLAEKASRYKFTTFHIPGKDNNIPDSLSRYPVGAPRHLDLEGEECGELKAAGGAQLGQWGGSCCATAQGRPPQDLVSGKVSGSKAVASDGDLHTGEGQPLTKAKL